MSSIMLNLLRKKHKQEAQNPREYTSILSFSTGLSSESRGLWCIYMHTIGAHLHKLSYPVGSELLVKNSPPMTPLCILKFFLVIGLSTSLFVPKLQTASRLSTHNCENCVKNSYTTILLCSPTNQGVKMSVFYFRFRICNNNCTPFFGFCLQQNSLSKKSPKNVCF